ncbi:unnamed protein product [Paramecium sonneborni]|uniref:DoxX family protein n=1 Tax=Paramecium sonneborni TaxID=65129 RepID=A0A8S1LR34_9CILI|nr:unnamed protein product [Paramecium sonneborni]
MNFFAILGRVLLAVIFIGAGIDKLKNPQHSVGLLNGKYPKFYEHLQSELKQYNLQLPVQLQPKEIQKISNELIMGVGVVEVLLSLFVVLNQGWAGKLLSFLVLSFVAVIHNPYIHGSSQSEKLAEQSQALWTLGIAGALMLIGTSSKNVNVTAQPATKSKGVAPVAPSQKAKKN